jgi:hypothetical protein
LGNWLHMCLPGWMMFGATCQGGGAGGRFDWSIHPRCSWPPQDQTCPNRYKRRDCISNEGKKEGKKQVRTDVGMYCLKVILGMAGAPPDESSLISDPATHAPPHSPTLLPSMQQVKRECVHRHGWIHTAVLCVFTPVHLMHNPVF